MTVFFDWGGFVLIALVFGGILVLLILHAMAAVPEEEDDQKGGIPKS